MRVAKQHPRIAVTTDESHLRHVQTLFKEAPYRFVPQVMEMRMNFAPSHGRCDCKQNNGQDKLIAAR
jgi:hypothetical protein